MTRGSLRVTADIRFAIEDLLHDYAACLDENRLADWPGFFVEDCRYEVLSRENVERGLPAPIIYHYSRGMLEDRVTAIRDALTFEFVYVRHVVSNIRILGRRDELYDVQSHYTVYQSTEEGRTRLFSVGLCIDEIVAEHEGLRFRSRRVIADTFAIDNCLAVPL